MLARLKAQRAAAENQAAAPAAPAAPKAPRASGAAKPASVKPAARPAAAKPAARPVAKPVAAAKRASADASDDSSDEPARGASGSRRGKTAGGSRRSGSARSGGRSSRGGEKKKKSMVPALVAIVGLALIGGGVWMFKDDLFGAGASNGSEVAAQETPAVEETTPDPMAETPEPTEEMPADDMAEGEADDAAAEGMEDEASPFEDGEEGEKAPKEVDPDSVDMSAIADFGPLEGTSDEQWAEANELAGIWLNVNSGAAGGRAKKDILAMGRGAFPVILNHMKTLDFSTKEGLDNGDQCQRALTELCNGTNFGWKFTTEPADVYFNKLVVVGWAKQWERAAEDVEYWIKMAKLEERDPEEAKRLRGGADAPEPPASSGGGDDGLDID